MDVVCAPRLSIDPEVQAPAHAWVTFAAHLDIAERVGQVRLDPLPEMLEEALTNRLLDRRPSLVHHLGGGELIGVCQQMLFKGALLAVGRHWSVSESLPDEYFGFSKEPAQTLRLGSSGTDGKPIRERPAAAHPLERVRRIVAAVDGVIRHVGVSHDGPAADDDLHPGGPDGIRLLMSPRQLGSSPRGRLKSVGPSPFDER